MEQLSMTGSLFGKILGKKCVFTIWLTLNNNIDECSPHAVYSSRLLHFSHVIPSEKFSRRVSVDNDCQIHSDIVPIYSA